MISEGYKSFETTISGVCFEAVAKYIIWHWCFSAPVSNKINF